MNVSFVTRCLVSLLLVSFIPNIHSLSKNTSTSGGSNPVNTNIPETWLNKLPDPNSLVMNPEQIKAFNVETIRKMPTTVYDLSSYPAYISKKDLIQQISAYVIPNTPMYINGKPANQTYYDNLIKETNLSAINERTYVNYAFAVARCNLRRFPTKDKAFRSLDDYKFDRFQETTLKINEPLVILQQSKSGTWFFVQTGNYRGWLERKNVALVHSREEWLHYMKNPDFLIITGSKVKVSDTSGAVEDILEMGTKLPLLPGTAKSSTSGDYYTVELPVRNTDGYLVYKSTTIPAYSDVSVGYLPYTKANVIKQAFKLHTMPYGWGGSFDSWDCSSFVADIYKCFGFALPRNAGEQEHMAGKTLHLNLSTQEKHQLLDTLSPGSTLYMPGHVMLYLGKHNGDYYIIHALAAYGEPNSPNPDGSLKSVRVHKVVVTTLNLHRQSGQTFFNSILVSKSIE